MTKEQQQVYQTFVSAQPQLPVFYQSWWLNAACGVGNWRAVLAYEGEQQVAAVWPYTEKKRLLGLLTTIDKPPLSLFCGPYVSPPDQALNPANSLSRHYRLLTELTRQLPPHRLRRGYLPYDQQNTLALQKLGWSSRQFHSYRLRSDQYSEEVLFSRLAGKVRSDLRAGSYAERIVPLSDPEIVNQLQRKSMAARAVSQSGERKVYFPEAVYSRLFHAARQRGQSTGWIYLDEEQKAVATVWLPFDEQSAYLIAAASDPATRSDHKAMTRLIWHAVKWCTRKQLIFDFEGSSLPGVEEYYRGWGPEVMSYYMVADRSLKLW